MASDIPSTTISRSRGSSTSSTNSSNNNTTSNNSSIDGAEAPGASNTGAVIAPATAVPPIYSWSERRLDALRQASVNLANLLLASTAGDVSYAPSRHRCIHLCVLMETTVHCDFHFSTSVHHFSTLPPDSQRCRPLSLTSSKGTPLCLVLQHQCIACTSLPACDNSKRNRRCVSGDPYFHR